MKLREAKVTTGGRCYSRASVVGEVSKVVALVPILARVENWSARKLERGVGGGNGS